MSTTLEAARRYQDVLATEDPQQQFAFATIFDDSSFRTRRRSKWKFTILQRTAPRLRQILWPGEKVRYLTRGTRFSFWESYFIGWIANLINRRAIVVTDQRVILVQIDWKSRPRELVEQLRYGAIESVNRTLLGNARVVLKDGRKVVFAHVPRADREFLAKLIGYTLDHVTAETSGVEDLCPHCFVAVADRPSACPSCAGRFKSVRTATLRSLLFPGLGDWYLGHRALAVVEMLFVALLWLGFFIPSEEYPFTLGGVLIGGLVLVVVIHVPDAVLTRYIARRGLYPES